MDIINKKSNELLLNYIIKNLITFDAHLSAIKELFIIIVNRYDHNFVYSALFAIVIILWLLLMKRSNARILLMTHRK